MKTKEAAWKDLGLGDLMSKGPGDKDGKKKRGSGGSRALPR
jgi:hypothetical protein